MRGSEVMESVAISAPTVVDIHRRGDELHVATTLDPLLSNCRDAASSESRTFRIWSRPYQVTVHFMEIE